MFTGSAIFCLLSLLVCFSSGQDLSLPKCSSENSYYDVMEELRKLSFEMKRELDSVQARLNVSESSKLSIEIKNLEAKIVELENNISKLQPLQPKEIAFTVTLDDSSTFTNIKKGQTIKFTSVIYNVGNGYDSKTGIFNCPVPGTYVFFVSIMSKPNIEVAVHVTVNGVADIAKAFGGAIPGVPVGIGTMAVVKLKKNDKVWVRSHQPNTAELNYSFGENSFSGFLLYQE